MDMLLWKSYSLCKQRSKFKVLQYFERYCHYYQHYGHFNPSWIVACWYKPCHQSLVYHSRLPVEYPALLASCYTPSFYRVLVFFNLMQFGFWRKRHFKWSDESIFTTWLGDYVNNLSFELWSWLVMSSIACHSLSFRHLPHMLFTLCLLLLLLLDSNVRQHDSLLYGSYCFFCNARAL